MLGYEASRILFCSIARPLVQCTKIWAYSTGDSGVGPIATVISHRARCCGHSSCKSRLVQSGELGCIQGNDTPPCPAAVPWQTTPTAGERMFTVDQGSWWWSLSLVTLCFQWQPKDLWFERSDSGLSQGQETAQSDLVALASCDKEQPCILWLPGLRGRWVSPHENLPCPLL